MRISLLFVFLSLGISCSFIDEDSNSGGVANECQGWATPSAKRLYLNRNLHTPQAVYYARDRYELVLVWPDPSMQDSCWFRKLDSIYQQSYGLSFSEFEAKLKIETDSISKAIPPELNYDGTFNFVTDRPVAISSAYKFISVIDVGKDTLEIEVDFTIDTTGRVVDCYELNGQLGADQEVALRKYLINAGPLFTPPLHNGKKVVFRYGPLHISLVP